MKKAALFSVLILFSLCMVGAPAASTTPSVEPLDANTVFPVELDFGMSPGPLPHCGDYCYTPGASRGCIDSSGSNWERTLCTCIGNTWTC